MWPFYKVYSGYEVYAVYEASEVHEVYGSSESIGPLVVCYVKIELWIVQIFTIPAILLILVKLQIDWLYSLR